MTIRANKESEIWAIGGGKGGIGKSFIISSIASCLAVQGKSVVLVDADMGGANLHTFLGLSRPKRTLTDFFDKKVPIDELIVDSTIPGLRLLSGTMNSLFCGSIKHGQKVKLFRQIKEINADYVLIDLGAGAHLNTIDAYLLADKMVAVIVPEVIALENMYYFLKNAFFRKLVLSLNKEGHKRAITEAWNNREKYGIENLKQLLEYLKGVTSEVHDSIEREVAGFTIHIAANKIKNGRDSSIGIAAKSICLKYFGFNARYVGYVSHDDFVTKSINSRQPYLQAYPGSICSRQIEKLTNNLVVGKQVGILE